MSRDHKVSDLDEQQRILKSGARIERIKDTDGNEIGPLRVFLKKEDLPALSISRCFGDTLGQKVGCIHTPEIFDKKLEITDKIIVIGSDGFFEHLDHGNIVQEIIP